MEEDGEPALVFGVLSCLVPIGAYFLWRWFRNLPVAGPDSWGWGALGAFLVRTWAVMLVSSIVGLGCAAVSTIRHERWPFLAMLASFVNGLMLLATLLPLVLAFVR